MRRLFTLCFMLWSAVANSSLFTLHSSLSSSLTFVELNCENLFDCRHDSLKQDVEFTPDGARHWTRTRYWRKLNHTGQTILSCSQEIPDLVALVEVENGTVLHDLTRRSLLRNAGYQYLMTESSDVRGIDVALLYLPESFRPICYESISIPLVKDMRPTRDILYVQGETTCALRATSSMYRARQHRAILFTFLSSMPPADTVANSLRVPIACRWHRHSSLPSTP